MKPSVGRIVHYQSYGSPGGEYKSEPCAAIVTALFSDSETTGVISLCVINPTGLFFPTWVAHAPDDVPTPGCWNWPPRV
jgi:hypothetical protein